MKFENDLFGNPIVPKDKVTEYVNFICEGFDARSLNEIDAKLDNDEFYKKLLCYVDESLDVINENKKKSDEKQKLNETEKSSEGGTRSDRGKFGEQVVVYIVKKCLLLCGINEEDYEIYIHTKKPTVCYIDENTYTKSYLDVHVYIKGILFIIIEAKSYTDLGMLQRTIHVTKQIKKFKKTKESILSYIISLENGIDDNSYNFEMYENKLEYGEKDYNFNGAHYLMSGKRKSGEPIYKPEYRKMIDKELLSNCINSICNDINEKKTQFYKDNE